MAEQYEEAAPVSAVEEHGHRMSIGRYLVTRVSTLKPPMNHAPNPFKALTLLNRQQWMFFLVSYP
jgi:SHS family lactate transporter-like MFS transporter